MFLLESAVFINVYLKLLFNNKEWSIINNLNDTNSITISFLINFVILIRIIFSGAKTFNFDSNSNEQHLKSM